MPQTKQQIQAMLAEASTSPRHRFGQNFMIDRNLVTLVADAGQITAHDVVIEVGPGTGTLTEELLQRASKVIAVEIDRDLAAMLRRHFSLQEKFQLIEGDALASKHRLNPELSELVARHIADGKTVKLVANLPYNIASPLVIELLIAGVSRLAFTVQKEVALRLKASASSDDYGPLTVMAQLLADVQVLRVLPPQAFWPAPKIDSALVTLERRDQLGTSAAELGTFVQALFASRRKMLRRALQQAGYEVPAQLYAKLGLEAEQRPETLTPRQVLALLNALKATRAASHPGLWGDGRARD